MSAPPKRGRGLRAFFVLSALLAGAVAGGLILSLGVIVPLRRKLERLRMQAAAPSSPQDTGA